MDKLYIVCVLYNNTMEKIASLDTFLRFAAKYDFIRLMVMDNSSEVFTAKNREASEAVYRDRIIYTDNGGNIGLSKAYNKALDLIKDDTFFVMWADDDTVFSDEYLENVIKAIEAGKTDIISGIIRSGDVVLSPAKKLRPFSSVLYYPDPGIYQNVYCINTGLTIKSTVFDAAGRYDERLFLDAVDHLFSDKLIAKGLNRVEIVPGEIAQNFAAFTDDLDARTKRVQIFSRDWLNWWRISHRHGLYIFRTVCTTNLFLFLTKLKRRIFKR